MKENLSWEQAEAVVRAFRAEQGISAGVEIDAIAATLGTTPAEIRRLAARRRRFIDRSGVLSASLALCIAGILAFLVPASRNMTPVRKTSRVHVAPTPTRDFVVIDLNTGREVPPYPADEPHALKIETL